MVAYVCKNLRMREISFRTMNNFHCFQMFLLFQKDYDYFQSLKMENVQIFCLKYVFQPPATINLIIVFFHVEVVFLVFRESKQIGLWIINDNLFSIPFNEFQRTLLTHTGTKATGELLSSLLHEQKQLLMKNKARLQSVALPHDTLTSVTKADDFTVIQSPKWAAKVKRKWLHFDSLTVI